MSGEAPQGNDLIVGYGFENQDNIWNPSNITRWIRARTTAGFVGNRPLEENDNMDPSGQSLAGSNESVALAPKVEWKPNVDDMPALLAHMNGFYGFAAQVGGAEGPYPFTSRPRERADAPPDQYVDSLAWVHDEGDGSPLLVSGFRAQDLSYKIAAGKLNDFSFGGLACFDSYTDDATELGAGAYTGAPIIRGHWDPDKSGPVKLKVTAAAAGGFAGTVKLTTAAYAGATTLQVNFDVWYRVKLDDGSRLGIKRNEDLWFCIPSTSPASALAVNQEWGFENQRATPVPTYTTRNAFGAAGFEMTIGGVLVPSHSIEVKRTRPRKANTTNGSKYAQNIQKNGDWMVEVSFDRDRNDRTFLASRIVSKVMELETSAYGDPFGSSGHDELWQSAYQGQVVGLSRDVNTKNALQEKVTLRCVRAGATPILSDSVFSSLSDF